MVQLTEEKTLIISDVKSDEELAAELESFAGQIDVGAIRSIKITNSSISKIPDSINRFTSLSELFVDRGNADNLLPLYVGPGIGKLPLVSLTLRNCGLKKIPDVAYGIGGLIRLDCSCNNIRKLTSSINKLKKLGSLNLGSNKLESIGYFVSVPGLKDLRLEHNKLKRMSRAIFRLKKLEVLDLGHNEISDVPDRLTETKGLKNLFLNDNKITRIRKSLAYKSGPKQDVSGYNETGAGFKAHRITSDLGGIANMIGTPRYYELKFYGTLDLSNNNIDRVAMFRDEESVLAKLAAQNLNISGNPIATDKKVLDSIGSNRYISHVAFASNHSFERKITPGIESSICRKEHIDAEPVYPSGRSPAFWSSGQSAGAKAVQGMERQYFDEQTRRRDNIAKYGPECGRDITERENRVRDQNKSSADLANYRNLVKSSQRRVNASVSGVRGGF